MGATVGSRELKTRLGRYLRLVKQGETVVVTERGRPIAELRPVEISEDDEEARLDELAALGVITRGKGGPLPPFRPVAARRGASLSKALSDDREDRL